MFLHVSFMTHVVQEHHVINKEIFCLKMLILVINYIVYCISVL